MTGQGVRRALRMAAGATELEERLADLLRVGLATADQSGYAAWEEMAARMVDAQAPGLAARVRELGALPFSQAGGSSGWPERLLSECALLHLLNRGLLTLDCLPEPLAATVRARVGRTVDSAELLADESARVRDEWLVLALRDSEEGRLTARRLWLYGRASGRPALLLSHAAGGRVPELALPVGSVLDADLSFYPGARPLRAALGERYAAPDAGWVPGGGTVTDALAAYGAALRDDPWLEGWPAVLNEAVPIPDGSGGGAWQVADATGGGTSHAGGSGGGTSQARGSGGGTSHAGGSGGGTSQARGSGGGTSQAGGSGGGTSQAGGSGGEFALPLAPGTSSTALWKLAAISGGGPVTVFGECGHRGFAPYTAWSGAEAVPL